jgi:hypothetical protein
MLDCYQRPGLVRGGRLSMLNRVIGLFQIFLFAFASHAFAKIENGNPESPDGRFRADYVGDETPSIFSIREENRFLLLRMAPANMAMGCIGQRTRNALS